MDTISSACETFKAYLGKKGLRVTSQRMAIFEAALAHKEHFTAEELLEHAREIDKSVSRATVYRTLPILTESELVREIDVGRDYKFYVASHGKHIDQAQVVDIESDKIYEIDPPFLGCRAVSLTLRITNVPFLNWPKRSVWSRSARGCRCRRARSARTRHPNERGRLPV